MPGQIMGLLEEYYRNKMSLSHHVGGAQQHGLSLVMLTLIILVCCAFFFATVKLVLLQAFPSVFYCLEMDLLAQLREDNQLYLLKGSSIKEFVDIF